MVDRVNRTIARLAGLAVLAVAWAYEGAWWAVERRGRKVGTEEVEEIVRRVEEQERYR